MNQLNGPFVIIALNINEGRGFDFLKEPLYIEASLKDSKIESDPVTADSNPVICTELVWETEKKEVRKLRSSHVPLRIDCYTLDENQCREKIGFVLLSLRSAEPVTSNQVHNVGYKWNKLITSMFKYRQCSPELSLTLTIRDQLEVLPNLPIIEPIIPKTKSEVIPIMYLDEGLIQIGSNTVASAVYNLCFSLKTTYNLDVLLPETQVFQQNSDKYYILLAVLGLSIPSKYFYSNLHEPITLNDRVIIKLQSNIGLLKLFFEQYKHIPVNFCHGNDVLGCTDIYLQNFICDENMSSNGAYSYEFDYEFKMMEKDKIKVNSFDDRKPYITIRTSLQIEQPDLDSELNKKDSQVSVKKSDSTNEQKSSNKDEQTIKVPDDSEISLTNDTPKSNDNIPKDIPETKSDGEIDSGNSEIELIRVKSESNLAQISETKIHKQSAFRKFVLSTKPELQYENVSMACGDQIDCSKIETITNSRVSPRKDVSIQTSISDNSSHSIETQASYQNDLMINASSSFLPENIFNSSNYHLYSLSVDFRSILWRKQVALQGFQLKLNHPKAKSEFVAHTNSNKIQPNKIIHFDNVYCNIFYICNNENAKILVSQYAPKVSIYSLDNVPFTDPLQIDTKLFLLENSNDCTYFAVLNKIFRKDDLICDLQMNLTLKDLGTNFELDNYKSNNNLKPLILDEYFSLKTLREHLDWKQSQETSFMEKMKELESEKLECLQKEWTIKRRELEIHLQDGIEKCRTMSQELSLAILNEKKQEAKVNCDETNSLFISDENRETIEMRVTQMLEEEMNATIERIEQEKNDLSKKIERLSTDKLALESKIQDLESKLEYLRQTTLTKEQTATLLKQVRNLEEEFHLIQKAKAFFKEQWQKALNEVHLLKSEDQRQIQEEIQKNKDELIQLNTIGERKTVSDTKLLQHTPRYLNDERVCSFFL